MPSDSTNCLSLRHKPVDGDDDDDDDDDDRAFKKILQHESESPRQSETV